MIRAVRLVLGWGLFLALALTALLIIRDNPHGSASLLQQVNHQVGSFASTAAAHLPSPSPPGRP